MKTMTATEARRQLGRMLSCLKKDSLLLEKNGKPAALVFSAEDGLKLILSAYAHGALSRSAAMKMLGYDWYSQLLDALADAGIERPSFSDKKRKKMQPTFLNLLRSRK